MCRPRRCGWHVVLLLAWLAAPAVGQVESDRFFEGDRVDRIDVWMHSSDWRALTDDFMGNTYYPADMTWNGQTVRNIAVRSRGGGSRLRAKPGLRLDFNRYTAEQTFVGLKSLVLDNNSQDASMMRERLTFDVFRKLGLPAPRVTHVELYVNGALMGLYTAVESVDKTFLQRSLGENDGYLFEYNYSDEWWFTDLGGVVTPYRQRFSAKTHESAPEQELYAPFIALVQAANRDGPLVQAMDPYLDVHLFAQHVAAELFMADSDGLLGYAGMNNFYLYRGPDGRARFLVWDKDVSLAATDYPVFANVEKHVLVRRMFEDAEVRDEIYEALRHLADLAMGPTTAPTAPTGLAPPDRDDPPATQEPGWLEYEARRVRTLIQDAAARDPYRPYALDTVEQHTLQVFDFAQHRAAFVRAEIEAAVARAIAPR